MYEILQDSSVFKGISAENISEILNNAHFQVKKFKKGDVIAFGNDTCNYLITILKGSVKGEMIDSSGKTIKVEDINAPQSVATAFLFGNNNKFPVNITANNDVELLFIAKDSVIKIIQSDVTFLINYLNTISNRAQFLANKIKFLSFKSIKGKIAFYILQLSKGELKTVTLPKSQKEIARLFGVERPSLSRAIRELEQEGIIKAQRRDITIIDKGKLNRLLL